MPHPAQQRRGSLQEHGLGADSARRALDGAGVRTLVPLVLTVLVLTHHLRGNEEHELNGLSRKQR